MSEAPLLEVSSLVKTYRSPGVGPFARKNARPALAGRQLLDASRGARSGSSANRAPASRRWRASRSRSTGRTRARCAFRDARCSICRDANCGPMRAHMQMIFQDPYGSLDPRQRVEKIVAEPLAALGGATGAERRARVRASLEAVGLKASDASKHPHEFSGGQRQRIAIARALITRPKLVVADEPVSALDVSVQAQTLNLMSDLEREAGVTFLLISHDLAVVAHICETTAVMYRGRIVEIGETDALFANPGAPLYARTGRRHAAPRPAGARARCAPGEWRAPRRPRAAPTPRAARSPARAAARRRQCSRRRAAEAARSRATSLSIRSASLTLM